MVRDGATDRLRLLMAIAKIAAAVLFFEVLATILREYRFYFPPDFNAAFLIGREKSFTPVYAAAFYTHLIAGPVTLLLGAFLFLSGPRKRFGALHRWAGRLQAVLILAALAPSGLVMAQKAFAGPIAGVGFTLLSLATAWCAVAAAYYAIRRKFVVHKRWANRCFILLVSPLILRLVSGVLIVSNSESETAYQLNAWLSWLVPLAIYEVAWRSVGRRIVELLNPRSPETPQEAPA